MKCPSCGVWNRAHFTKCFRCGADLTAASEETEANDPLLPEEPPKKEPFPEETPVEAPVFEDIPLSVPSEEEPSVSEPKVGKSLPWVEDDSDPDEVDEEPDEEPLHRNSLAALLGLDSPSRKEKKGMKKWSGRLSFRKEAVEEPDEDMDGESDDEFFAPQAPSIKKAAEPFALPVTDAPETPVEDDVWEETDLPYVAPEKESRAEEGTKPEEIPVDKPSAGEKEPDAGELTGTALFEDHTYDYSFESIEEEPKQPYVAPVPHEEDEDDVVTVALHKNETGAPEETVIFPGVNTPETPFAEDTRKFTLAEMIRSKPELEGTRKFNLSSLPKEDEPMAEVSNEPKVAPTQPGISHEIINAIFTNPQPSAIPGEAFSSENARPRKLMSLRNFHMENPEEDEPETQFIEEAAPKAEPVVEDVKQYKPTARLSAKKADEADDEFTAFVNAKRSLVAEVMENDPFDSAIELPKEKKNEKEPSKAEKQEGEDVVPVIVEPAARLSKAIEVPPWAQQAMASLEDGDLSPTQPASTPSARSKRRSTFGIQEDLSEGTIKSAPAAADNFGFVEPMPVQSAPRSGLEAIARHDTARKKSVLTGRAFGVIEEQDEQPAPAAPVKPIAKPAPSVKHAPIAEPAPSTKPESVQPRPQQNVSRPAPRANAPEQKRPQTQQQRPAAPQQPNYRAQQTAQRQPQRAPAQTPPRPQQAVQKTAEKRQSPPKVNNLPRLILSGAIALILVVLLFWGIISGIKAIVKKAAENKQNAEAQQTEAPVVDENAPVITEGERNGHPTHVLTFKGNDNDIIYVSGESLHNSYNVPIVSGIGTLEIDDSELIGNRYANEDIEVTLNPVLHEASSGKETILSPVVFTVTPPSAYLEIVTPEGGKADTTLGSFQVKIRVELGSIVTIDGSDVSDMIAEETNEIGSIVFNVSVDPIGDNSIPVTVMKEGCKSVTETIVINRPKMTVPIELDPSTPSTSNADTVVISGSVDADVKVSVNTPTVGNVTMNDDGTFSFTAQLSIGPNDVVITASNGTDSSDLTHTITYTPTYSDYVALSYKMDYNALSSYAGKYQPFKCTGFVIEVFTAEPYTCLFNVGSEEDPKYIYLQMVEGKPLSEDHRYSVYADVHSEGTHDGYPYMIGRYFIEDDE